jgi:small subunit ribosomal protein S15
MLNKHSKAEIIQRFQKHENDTASAPVQIAILTARLEYLNTHFKSNKKDHHSRRGLMQMVGQRRRLLDYMHKKTPLEYKELIQSLGIRK